MPIFPFYPFYHNYYNYYYPHYYKNNGDIQNIKKNENNLNNNINQEDRHDNSKNEEDNLEYKRKYEKKTSKNNFFANINLSALLESDLNSPIIEILGIKLYLDDLIIIGLLFFLYKEGVQDEILFGILLLLLLTWTILWLFYHPQH